MERQRILLITNDEDCQNIARNALEPYELVVIENETQGMEFFRVNEECALCLLDDDPRRTDAFKLYREIRGIEKYKTLPVIFITDAGDAQADIEALKLGVSDFIKRPVAAEILRHRAEKELAIAAMRGQLKSKHRHDARKVSSDPLTGLLNRQDVESEINSLISDGATGTMMMFDLDNFKLINDVYGHIAGDGILTDFADILRKNFRETDLLCRLGGDEFIVFANGLISKEEIKNRALDCIFDLDRRVKELKYEVNTSASLGISQTPQDGEDFKRLYYCADKALYHVKQNGKHSFYFYDDQCEEEEKRAEYAADLYQIEEMFARLDSGRGAYLVDFDTFPVVYNFIRRFMERNGRDVQVVLFTAIPNDAQTIPMKGEIENVLELLNRAVCTSLRKVDASTKYSSRQVIVLLVDSNTTNGDLVARRVIRCFESMYTAGRYHLEYDITQMPQKC